MCRIIALLIFTPLVFGSASRERLFQDLFQSYNKNLKPDGKVVVKHAIDLISIGNYEDGVLTANTMIQHEWNDGRLRWSPADYDQIDRLTIPSRLLWKPDIVLYNNAGPDSGKIFSDLNAVLYNTGNLIIVPQMRIVSRCQEQGWIKKSMMCQWKYGSWTYSGLDIDLVNITSTIGMSSYAVYPKYDIKSTEVSAQTLYYPCCPEPYPSITYIVELQKNLGL